MEQINKSDEIDIRELFETLKERKKLIYVVTGLITLFAIVYALVWAKPVYEVKAMIEIGKTDAGTKDETPLDNITEVKQKLEYTYGIKSKKKRTYPRVKSISISRKSMSIVAIVVEGKDNESAIGHMDKVISQVESSYKLKIKAYTDAQEELISLTEKDILTNEKNLKNLNDTLKDYNEKILNITQKDAALAGLYTIQISQNIKSLQDIQLRISNLKMIKINLKLSIAPLRIVQTHSIGNIEVLDKPVKPKKVLIVIVSFITGLMVSIFLVFFLSFLRGIKED